MTDNDDFKTLRRYTHDEAAERLRIPVTWLRRWVTSKEIPHQRSGRARGVWFTYDDILGIGRMLPELMTGNQANRRAKAARSTGADDGAQDLAAPSVAGIREDELAAFRNLKSISSRG